MTNQSTIDKLIEMRMTSMADAFRIQMDDSSMKEVPFEDRFGMLVDVEYSNRKNNRLKRLIRQAEFEQPDASMAAIDYQSGRKLNKALISRLATCEYITEYRNIFITGEDVIIGLSRNDFQKKEGHGGLVFFNVTQ
jgi:DNA replication protein DnaC